jgi:hypothetical protein
MTMNLKNFRKKIEEATQGNPQKHPENIASLLKYYPHSITLQSNPISRDPTIDCFLFVFQGKLPNELVEKIEKFYDDTSNVADYFHQLLDDEFIEMHTSRKANDEVVVYFKDGVPAHFGRLENDLVISKWGIGLIWKHKLFELPLSYGDTAKYSDGNIDIEALKRLLS